MTHKDAGKYKMKHPEDRVADPGLIKAVKGRSESDRITCAAAFKLVEENNSNPEEIGFVIDHCEIKISKCQLGLFGYGKERKVIKPSENIPDDHKESILQVVDDNKISCESIWNVAVKLKLKKMDVSSVCEAMKVKIINCQLGAF